MLRQLQNMAQRATIYPMDIITFIISLVALLVSAANFYTLRGMSKDPASIPDAGTRGAGGSGRR